MRAAQVRNEPWGVGAIYFHRLSHRICQRARQVEHSPAWTPSTTVRCVRKSIDYPVTPVYQQTDTACDTACHGEETGGAR